jgi:GH24 family phage-related lysozyme (muramidase)
VNHNAYNILSNLTAPDAATVRGWLELGPAAPWTAHDLERFAALSAAHGLPLTPEGVNAFKDSHKLGNTGVMHGVIGAQTAQFYFTALKEAMEPKRPAAKPVTINDQGMHLVKEFEGLHQKGADGLIHAYLDPINIPTIGYGHTHGVRMGMAITMAQADQFLHEDLHASEAAVLHSVSVPLTSNQFSALVSFTFNCGAGALANSTLLRKLNAKDYAGAAEEFGKWVNGNHGPLPGLVSRRAAEKKLFQTPDA